MLYDKILITILLEIDTKAGDVHLWESDLDL